MLTVTHRVEDAHEDVVHHCKDGTQEVVAEILDGLGQHLGGRSHPSQNGGGQRHTGDSQRSTGDQAKGNGGVDSPFHRAVFPGTKRPGNDHACAHRHTVKEADHHKDQAAGGADCRQGIIAYVVAHSPSIKSVVKLLEHIAQEHRQGEKQHRFPNRSFGEGILLGPQCGHLLSKNCHYYSTLFPRCNSIWGFFCRTSKKRTLLRCPF